MAKYSDLFMDWLVEAGYTHCFYVSGGNVMHLLESASSRFKCTPFVHEVGACIAVDYFNEIAKPSERAFLVVTAGPGITNAITGIAGAWIESRELLIIGGQAKSTELSKGKFRQIGFQEFDGAQLCKSVTKASIRVDKQISKLDLFNLVNISKVNRKGPVFIEVCLDVTNQERDAMLDAEINYQVVKESPELQHLENISKEISNLIQSSNRPIILIGGGVDRNLDLEPLLSFNLPIATTFNGADRVNAEYEFYCGRPNWYGSRWANILIQQADLIIALGTRLGIMQVGYNWKEFAPKSKIVQIDIDENELNKGFPKLDRSYSVDCNELLKILPNFLVSHKPEKLQEWKNFIKDVRSKFSTPDPANYASKPYIESTKFIFDLMHITSGDEVLIPCSSGAAAYESAMRIIMNKKRQLMVTSHGSASMGYGLSGGIGAAIAHPEKKVIVFEGDGGFAQNLQELGTAMINNLRLKIFVMDNQGYQSIRGNQKSSFNGHYIGCDKTTGLGLPDWVILGKAYGFKTFEIDSESYLSDKFLDYFNLNEPVIFIVKIDPDQTYWPRLLSKRDELGNIESNPLHLMDPPLSANDQKKYYKFL